jgi:hypothetical protein
MPGMSSKEEGPSAEMRFPSWNLFGHIAQMIEE